MFKQKTEEIFGRIRNATIREVFFTVVTPYKNSVKSYFILVFPQCVVQLCAFKTSVFFIKELAFRVLDPHPFHAD